MTAWRAVRHNTAPDTHVPDDWRTRAACRGEGDVMFPERSDTPGLRAARSVCASCPVQAECLTDALTSEEGKGQNSRWGIYAGTTPRYRVRLHEQIRRGASMADLVEHAVTPRPHRRATDIYRDYAVPTVDGHARWTGASTFTVGLEVLTRNQVAFLATRGRPSRGRVRATCGQTGCVQAGHLVDDRDRAKRGGRAAA